MREPRKADSPRLDLCALAEMRMPELRAHAACKGCLDERGRKLCDGTKCATWKSRAPVLGRKDWPACPIAMTLEDGWREVREVYLASKVSPLANFPDGYVAGAVDAFVEIKHAGLDEEKRQMDATKDGPKPDAATPRAHRGGR